MSSNPIFLDPGFLLCIALAIGLTVFFLLRKKCKKNKTCKPDTKQQHAAQPAPEQEPAPDAQENFVLGKRGKTCTVGKDGIRYATEDGEIFAPYSEIENMSRTGGILCQFLYRGKAYDMSLDASPAGRTETTRAFTYASGLWTEARRNRPAVKRAGSPDELVYFADNGSNTLAVHGDHCILTARKTAVNLVISEKFFNGEKKLYYADLVSVQFREPDLTDGYIEFEFPGSHSGKNSSAYTSENAFQFGKLHAPLMREIRDFIDGRIREQKQQSSRPAEAVFSPADELKKFKELLDSGVITQEEFDAKKKQLLGL